MKKSLLFISAAMLSATTGFSQLGTAHDFTVTDIEGNTHHLYEILDAGYVVVLDASATWCGTCWGVHNQEYLNDLNTQKGPTGTNEIRVIFYEADGSTDMADLQGTGDYTQGNWISGTNYPIVNEYPITLNGNVYWPLGFPTINVIRPGDREITADIWNQNLNQMINTVNAAIESNPQSIGSDWLVENGISVYPNPTAGDINVNLGTADALDGITLRNTLGQAVKSISTNGLQRMNISLTEIPSGIYHMEFQKDGITLGVQRVVKN
jgi:hypothetical protein